MRSDSSFAFTALKTNGSELMPRNRFLRRGYWLMNVEVKFKRKTFNCSDGELLMRFRLCVRVSLVIVNDYGITVVKLYCRNEAARSDE